MLKHQSLPEQAPRPCDDLLMGSNRLQPHLSHGWFQSYPPEWQPLYYRLPKQSLNALPREQTNDHNIYELKKPLFSN